MGFLTSAGYLVATRGLSARAVSTDGTMTGQLTSPPTTPFIVPLPIPPVAQPVAALNPAPTVAPNTAAGEGRTRPHQVFSLLPPQKFYEVHVKEAQHSFHPELPLQTIWGHNGTFPGPTFIARYGEPILVRRFNDLPANHVGFGIPQITTHLHNGHSPSESDGFPGDFYNSGQWYDHHYPMVFAGYEQSPGTLGDPKEALTTLWYHDHRFDFTAQNTYKGLEGFQIHYDATDSGDETDPNPNAYRLPSGEFDVPLLFADKVFDPTDGQLYFDLFNFDGILGDKFTVNGKIQPFFQVHPRKYRFRCLDGGPSRFYEFFLTDLTDLNKVIPFTLIANENLLTAPLQAPSFRIGVAERMDVIIDFSPFAGKSIYLENRLEQLDGRGPTGNILPAGQGNLVLRFDVVLPKVADPSQVPATLTALPTVNRGEVAATRTWVFNRNQGAWTVNGQFFDVNTVQASVKKGTAEIWILQNGGGGWTHPIHIHHGESRIVSRNGSAPPPEEVCMKDVFKLRPSEQIVLFRRFRDFLGRYPIHCHNTVHEDHAMMARWDIVP